MIVPNKSYRNGEAPSWTQPEKLRLLFLGEILILFILLSASCSPGSTDAGKPVVLSFAFQNTDQEAYFQSLRDEFRQENPAIDIQFKPLEDMGATPMDSLAKSADVFLMEGINPARLPGFAVLQPLADITPDFNAEDFWPATLAACSDQQGILYGVPVAISPVGIYYDQQIFDQYQVPYPESGWTWMDFQQTLAKFASRGGTEPVYGLVEIPAYSIVTPILDSQLQYAGGQVDVDTLAASVDWYLQFVAAEKIFPQQSALGNNRTDNFELLSSLIRKGQAAMWIDSPDNDVPGLSDEEGAFVPFPVDIMDDHTTPAYYACGVISSGSKYPQQAWTWLNFLSHRAPSIDHTSGKLPARMSVVDASYWDDMSSEVGNAMRFALEHAWYPSSQLETLNAVIAAVKRAVNSGTDLAAELRAKETLSATSQSNQSTPTFEPFTINTPEPTPAAEVRQVHFLANWGSGDYTQKLSALSAEFMSIHPDIRVNLSTGFSAPEGGFLQKLALDYDCFAFESPRWEALSDKDLLDLTAFLEENPSLAGDFPAAFLEPFESDGKLFALPADVLVEYIAYNKDLLIKRGLPLPASGWHVEEMMDLATQAADPVAPTPIFGLVASNDILLQALGIQWFDNLIQPPRALFNTSELSSALEWINQLYLERVYLPAYGAPLPEERKPKDYPPYEQVISNGQVALWVTSNEREYEKNAGFEIGFLPFPDISSGAAIGYPLMIQGYFISHHSDQPGACWEWIRFLSDHPSVLGGYSPRRSVLESSFIGEKAERFGAVQGAFKQYSGYVYAAQYDPLLRPYTEALWAAELAVLQGESVTQILAEKQRKADAYYNCISTKDLSSIDNYKLYQQVALPCTESDQP